MKLPRNISGKKLVKLLENLDYQNIRQRGSHIQVTTQINGEHHLAISQPQPN
jgi:predicted RNA binding protein YcfA (HicA-like mRNA interferase family)